MIGIELIISGVVYVVTNGALAAVIIMLKKIGKQKYKELATSLTDLIHRNSQIYEMLTEPAESQRSELEQQERGIINEPITPDNEQRTHRDIPLKNGAILRLKLK